MSVSVAVEGSAVQREAVGHRSLPRPLIYLVFFVSGASALIYQTAWQRLLGLFAEPLRLFVLRTAFRAQAHIVDFAQVSRGARQ